MLNERYELRGLIGRGGMAEVHRGFDVHLGRNVAIKMVRASLVDDTDHRRFVSEMRLLASLNHPHLVMLLDAGTDEADNKPCPWLVMELVDGPSLAQRLAGGPLTPGEAASIGAGLAAALAHVHANGIVHRDVKPANVLLTPDGQAKLADFGVARMMNERSDLTGTGRTIGTAAYLAPEQVAGQPVTGATDIYALGLVLLESMTGQRAYQGTPTEAALARLHHRPLIPVSLGAEWVHLLDAMTATEPAERPEAAAVAARLTGLPAQRSPALVAASAVSDEPTGMLAIPAAIPAPIPPAMPAAATSAISATSTRTTTPHGRRPWHSRSVLAAAAVAAVLLLTAGAVELIDGATNKPAASATTKDPSGLRSTKVRMAGQGMTASTPSPTQTTSALVDVNRQVSPPREHHRAKHHKARHHKVRHHKARHHKARHHTGHGHGHGHKHHGKGHR